MIERIAVRSTSIPALMAELHREDLLREAAGRRGEPAPSIAHQLRLLAQEITRRLGRLRGGQPAEASGSHNTAMYAAAATASLRLRPANSSPGCAVACSEC